MMNSSNNTNKHPAFPAEALGNRNLPPEADYIQSGFFTAKFPGITIRDYFAAKVLQGICASGYGTGWTDEDLATATYSLTDAILKERSKSQETPIEV